MPEPIVPDGTNDSQAEALKAQIEELTKRNTILETEKSKEATDKQAAVDELKENRTKMAELKRQLAEKGGTDQPADVDNAVAAALAKRDKERADTNKVAALDKFVKSHKEFLPENDPTGLKLQAFKGKLSRFNTDGLTEVEQFMEVFEDAGRLLGHTPQQKNNKPVMPNIPPSSDEPAEVIQSQLSPKEKKVLERMGWTEEKYLALKKKMPDYVERIFRDL